LHGGRAAEDISMANRIFPASERAFHEPASVPDHAFAYFHVLAFELGRAMAAASRYEQLRLEMHPGDAPYAHPARRVYLEFYADR
jgi:hypothetical protein